MSGAAEGVVDGPNTRRRAVLEGLWSDTSPLGLRCMLAMARVMEPFDLECSLVLRDRAEDLASTAGENAAPDEDMPALISDDEDLAKAFDGGRDQADMWRNYLNLHPSAVWCDTWSMDLDGLNETRASVAKSADGFLPALEVSHRGGDCEPTFGDALPTLEQAIKRAKAFEQEWHRQLHEDLAENAQSECAR